MPTCAARAHLAGGAGQPGGAHVLNADDGAGLHGFEAGFEQQLFQKGIADLHVGPLGFGGFAEFLAGHGGAVNAVAAGFRADVNHRIAFARRLGVENLVAPDQSQSESIDQRIAGVAGLELGFAAQVGHAKTISVGGDAADHAFEHGLVLVDSAVWRERRSSGAACERPPHAIGDRAEAQRIHHRDRPRAHGENVAQDAAHAGGRALKRLDERWMIVRFDLEGAGPAVADVDDARVLARPLHHQPAARRQPLQMHARGFVGAVLAPHHAEDAQFGDGGLASAQQLFDLLVFVGREAVLPDDLGSDDQVLKRWSYGETLLSHNESSAGPATWLRADARRLSAGRARTTAIRPARGRRYYTVPG